MAQVFVTNRTNVQLPRSEENPEGGVVVLQPGFNEVDDELMKSEYLKRLGANETAIKNHQAELDSDKKVLEAEQQGATARAEANKAKVDELNKAGEEWAQKRQDAMERGVAFSDIHPDPNVQDAINLTQAPGAIAAVGMVRKDDPTPNTRVRPVPEGETTEHEGGEHHTRHRNQHRS